MQAHDFDFYDDLGIDLRTLGVLMLDTETPLAGDLLPDGQYVANDPKLFWINGLLDNWHVTARYGFLTNVRQEHVQKVLTASVVPASLDIDRVEVFPSNHPGEDYECVVALVKAQPGSDIFQLNSDLGVLPNVATFTEYKPHITIGYFEQGWFEANKNDVLLKESVPVLGTNFGGMSA